LNDLGTQEACTCGNLRRNWEKFIMFFVWPFPRR
jgi:hypothetical protein